MTVVANARTRTRRVTKATMRFSLAPSGGVASSTMTVRVTRAKGSVEGMSARATVARAFRGADPQTEEEEGSVLDFPEEYVRAVPSRRPDIFPDLKEPKTPMPQKMPGDPEMPDEEEEEKERKENPGEPGEKPEDEEEEEAEKQKKKAQQRKNKKTKFPGAHFETQQDPTRPRRQRPRRSYAVGGGAPRPGAFSHHLS